MAYDPARIALARAAVRWNYTLGSLRPPPEAPPPVEPLTEQTLAAIRRSLKAEPTPVPESPPPKRQPTEFRGALRTYSFTATTLAGLGNSAAMTTQQISLPSIVRRLLITTDATAETMAEILASTVLSVNPTEAEVRAGQQIYPDISSGIGGVGIHNVVAGSTFTLPMDKVITQIPFRLAVYIENLDAGPHRVHAEITTQDLDPEDVRIISVPVILRPQVLTRSLRTSPLPPPVPAMRGTTIPRGVTIKVFRDGETIASRDIAWASLDQYLKKEYFNYALSGVFPRTMTPIY